MLSQQNKKNIIIFVFIFFFVISRFLVTLGTHFNEAHNKDHIIVLVVKIIMYLGASIYALSYFSTKNKPVNLDLALFTSLCILICTVIILAYTDIYKTVGINAPAPINGITQDTYSCFYFSIVTWTTLGYGDFTPSEHARIFAASEGLIGAIMMAMITGFWLNLLIAIRETRTEVQMNNNVTIKKRKIRYSKRTRK